MYIIPERMCQAMERKTGAQPPVFLTDKMNQKSPWE